MMDKSCFDCRYFESTSLCCNKLWNTKSIHDTELTATNCRYFVKGDYDEDLIEKEFWERERV